MKSLRNLNLLNNFQGGGSQGQTPRGLSDETPRCRICRVTVDEMQCNGSGFYDLDVPVGDPNFSRTFRCPNNPIENDAARQSRLLKFSNLDAFKDKTFESFNLEGGGNLSSRERRSLEIAREKALIFAEDKGPAWLILQGGYGSGKTHLAAAIGNVCISRGEIAIFTTVPDLLDNLRGGYSSDADGGYNAMFDRVRNASLLILDDLGVENSSEWAKEKLFQLLNHRYSHRLRTIITTNADLDLLDPRIRSRLLDLDLTQIARIEAPDFRTPILDSRYSLSDLDLYALEYTFEKFELNWGAPHERQNLQRIWSLCREYAQSKSGWLVLLGNSGTGKTHLAAAIANVISAENEMNVMFVNTADLLDYLRETFNPDSPVSFADMFARVKNADFLVLDDLIPVDNSKSWVKEKILQIIKHRYVRRLPTVITTTQELETMNEQIRTRLKDRRIVRLLGISARSYVDRKAAGGG